MAESNDTLIKMEGVQEVFLTDKVETHALEKSTWKSRKGRISRLRGPSRLRQSTLLRFLDCWIHRATVNYWLNGQPVANLSISERTRIRIARSGSSFQAFNLIGDLTCTKTSSCP